MAALELLHRQWPDAEAAMGRQARLLLMHEELRSPPTVAAGAARLAAGLVETRAAAGAQGRLGRAGREAMFTWIHRQQNGPKPPFSGARRSTEVAGRNGMARCRLGRGCWPSGWCCSPTLSAAADA